MKTCNAILIHLKYDLPIVRIVENFSLENVTNSVRDYFGLSGVNFIQIAGSTSEAILVTKEFVPCLSDYDISSFGNGTYHQIKVTFARIEGM